MPTRRDLANAIRFLSMDAVQKANSGHPGMPMGMADIAEVLWQDFYKHSPSHPLWENRDRFILSNGHGSMLLYSLLYLTGYDLPLEELKNFRQLNSKTPGHPEFGHTPGVDTTTGPLGNGIANAVGMALAERKLAAEFNRPGFDIVDHYTYVFMGDGCLMEGLSHEACSLAGTQKLGKLIAFWDDNGISIDGKVDPWFSDHTPLRFEAYGWHVIAHVDGHDSQALHEAIKAAKLVTDKPSLICCRTTIGFGAPNVQGTAKTHGAPLGEAEIAAARETLGWNYPPFEIPADIAKAWNNKDRGNELYDFWQNMFNEYALAHPTLAAEFKRRMAGSLPQEFSAQALHWIRETQETQKSVGTRKASQECIRHFTELLPELIGGSADLSCSNLTDSDLTQAITPEHPGGNYVNYGVREFGMSAIMNGMALHGGMIPFGGTFLVFSDYARNAVRLSALMKQRVIYVYTHDSIGVGEDGPTHQPIEQIASLRLIPGVQLWRPCDKVETAVAWSHALQHQHGPSLLALSRQNTVPQARTAVTLEQVARGGYILQDCEGSPDLILMATGSEVELATQARDIFTARGLAVRVVSMPCFEVFKSQTQAYQTSVLSNDPSKRLAIEAGSSAAWFGWVPNADHVIGIDQFGLSAPGPQVFSALGMTVAQVVNAGERLLKVNPKEVSYGN
jgi:transketolase